jgi:hypothetical protein
MTTQKYNCLLLYAYYVKQHMATPKGKIAKLQQKSLEILIFLIYSYFKNGKILKKTKSDLKGPY